MVSDMVYNFVLPEVEKEIMRKKLRDKQRRYLSAAHEAIYDRILDLPSRGVSESEEELEENKNKNVVWVKQLVPFYIHLTSII